MPVSSIIPVVEDYREVILPAGYADQIRHSILIGDYLYYFCGFPLGQMLKINKSDFTDRTVLTFPNDGKHRVPLEMCHVGGILYCLFRNVDTNDVPDFQLTIGRVQVSPFAILSDFVDVAATYIVQNGSITTDDTFLYVIAGTATLYATRKILKYALSGGAPTVADVTGFGSCHCVRYAGGKLYLAGWDFPANAHLARMTTGLVIEQSVDFEAADGEFSENQFAMSEAHIWIADRSLRGIVKKFTKSDLATVTDLPTGQLSRYTSSANDGRYIWVLFENGRSVRINPSDNAQAVYTLNDGQGFQSELLGDGTYIWTGWNQDATKIARYHIPPDTVPGQLQWLMATTTAASGEVTGIKTDSSGNLIAVGYYTGSPDFGDGSVPVRSNRTIFICKYDSGKNLLWKKTIGDSTSSALAVAVDSSDSVIVAGYCNGTMDFGNGNTSAGTTFCVKYLSNGAFSWLRRFVGGQEISSMGVAVDSSGTVFQGISMQGSMDFGGGFNLTASGVTDLAIVKLAASTGVTQWAVNYGGAGIEYCRGIACDATGGIYAVGQWQGDSNNDTNLGGGNQHAAGGFNLFIAKYLGSTGAWVWSKVAGTTGNNNETNGVTVDPRTNYVWVTGSFNGTINLGGTDLRTIASRSQFVAAYDSTGLHKYSRAYTGKRGRGIAFSGDVQGLTGDGAAVDWNNTGVFQFGSGFYVALFTVTGIPTATPTVIFQRAMMAQGTYPSEGSSVTFDPTNIYGGGLFFGSTDFGGQSGTAGVQSPGIAVAKYSR